MSLIEIRNGIDLVEISRLRELNPKIRERFLHRVFTAAELEESGARDASLAGKFAAKEAAAKALGCGIGRVTWQELEISSDQQGKPFLHLHGNAAQVALEQHWSTWSLSIAHTKDNAVASLSVLIDKN